MIQQASFDWTIFANVDLSRVRALDIVRHHGPSTIGIDTYIGPVDAYPKPSCVGRAGEFNPLRPFAHGRCHAFSFLLYLGLNTGRGGKKVHEQIEQAIRRYEKLVLILSPHSMGSNWVRTEIANARAREQAEGVQMLFPISLVPYYVVRGWTCFDADTGIDSAREVREFFIPDFSQWKNRGCYLVAFERVLRDLKPTCAA